MEGKLVEVNEDGIIIESVTGKGKKMQTVQHTVLFDNIKTTKVQIKF
jgi:ribosome maturation factor RimP